MTIPAEIVDHERVSEHLNRTIAKIRTPPKHSYETDFNPCDLLGVIRKKLVVLICVCLWMSISKLCS